RGLQVLLVEDDPTVAAVIVGMLQAQGQHVVHVGDGLQGLAELERGRLDAVLLDLDLPGIDGFQVARLMRQHAAGAQLPIIAVTARSAATDEAEAQRAGMDGFLRKPLTGAELAAMLNRVLDADRADVEPTAVDPA
ncbi:MAG: response regulator, partial [Rhodanobacter sp.]